MYPETYGKPQKWSQKSYLTQEWYIHIPIFKGSSRFSCRQQWVTRGYTWRDVLRFPQKARDYYWVVAVSRGENMDSSDTDRSWLMINCRQTKRDIPGLRLGQMGYVSATHGDRKDWMRNRFKSKEAEVGKDTELGFKVSWEPRCQGGSRLYGL